MKQAVKMESGSSAEASERASQSQVRAGRRIEIGHERTCACAASHISCITAKEWLKAQVTIQEFFYEGRDIRDKDVHPAVFPIALPAHFIRTLTHPGELILDPFAGVGTTLVAAQDLDRNAVGFDLHPEFVKVAKGRLTQSRLGRTTQQLMVQAEAHEIPSYLEEGTVALSVTSPPYANMLNHPRLNKSIRADRRENSHYLKVQQYSKDPRDLGTMDHQAYEDALAEIYSGIFPLLRPRAHCVVNVNDVWENNRRFPTHVHVMKALTRAGFEFRNTFIWDKRPLVNQVGIFGWPNNFISLGTTMEFILDFWRRD
jgi:DNA modification methylase